MVGMRLCEERDKLGVGVLKSFCFTLTILRLYSSLAMV